MMVMSACDLENNIWTADVFSLILTVAIIWRRVATKHARASSLLQMFMSCLRTKHIDESAELYPGITDLFFVTICHPEYYCCNKSATTDKRRTAGRQKSSPNPIYKIIEEEKKKMHMKSYLWFNLLFMGVSWLWEFANYPILCIDHKDKTKEIQQTE